MGSIKMVEQEDRCTIENSEQALLIERKKINDGKTHKKKLCLGIVLALASNVLGTSNNFIIKSFNVVVADAVLVRSVIEIALFSSIIWTRGKSMFPDSRRLIFLTLSQGICRAICHITVLSSMRMIPVVEAMAIIYLAPVITMFLSSIIISDRLNFVKVSSAVILICGELLICQPFSLDHSNTAAHEPSDRSNHLLGVGLAFTACVSGSLDGILVNMLKTETVPVTVLLNWAAIFVALIAVIDTSIMADSHILSADISSIHIDNWFILLGVAFSGILSFLLLTLSLQQASPTPVSSIRSFELVMATAVTAILANSSPTVPVIFGVLLITTGILFLTFHSELTKSLKKWTSIIANSRHSISSTNNYGSI